MSFIQFRYEISSDEFVSAQLLYAKRHHGGRVRGWAAFRILLGVVLNEQQDELRKLSGLHHA
jgi:hypothetical protein